MLLKILCSPYWESINTPYEGLFLEKNMITALKNAFRRNPAIFLMLLTIVLAPHPVMAAGFISKALGNSTAQIVIQVLGSIAVALNIAGVIQGFMAGSGDGWLTKGIGIVAGVILIVEPGLLGTTMNSVGL